MKPSSIFLSVAVVFMPIAGFFYIFPNQAFLTVAVVKNAGLELASAVVSHNFLSIAQIQSHYNNAVAGNASPSKARILLVPGHQPSSGGAEYGSLKERDMVVELADDLQQFLQSNSHYQVFVSRDTTAWSPIFMDYFNNNWNDIITWTKASRDDFSHLVAIGSVSQEAPAVQHNNTPADAAYRLYGVTKWADENNIDIIIHIHFNDDPRKNTSLPGNHSGFAIYVPAGQYGNSATTKAVAEDVFKRLAKYNPVSDLRGESTGIVDDPELIAIGANDTSNPASMLIEYSYIYEPELQSASVRSMVLQDFAFQTFLGLQDFFNQNGGASPVTPYDTSVLPYHWGSVALNGSAATPDVFALQTALVRSGVYPPAGKNENDCPRTGIAGACTRTALAAFQNQYGIKDENGFVGPKTLQALNQL